MEETLKHIKQLRFIGFLIFLFLFNQVCSPVPASVEKRYYAKEYVDLQPSQKKVIDGIITLLKENSENDLPDELIIKTHLPGDALVRTLTALEYSYFPYTDYRNISIIDGTRNWDYDKDILIYPKEMKIAYEKEKKYKKIAEKWVKECTSPNMSNLDKAQNITKLIAKKSSYTDKYLKPYSLLKEGKGVCNSYAILLKEMMQIAGIKSARYCYGYYENSYHAWVTYSIDKKVYYIDPTHYDNTGNPKYINMKRLPNNYHLDYIQSNFCYDFYH